MFLNDIGKSPDMTFKRINQHLDKNYGFKISEDVSDRDLVSIMEQIQDEITGLKIKGDDSKSSSEISKRLLVLEGIRNLREFAMMSFQSPKLNGVVSNLVDFVVDSFEVSGINGEVDFERALSRAMDEYRSSRYRFPDEMIEHRVRQDAMTRIQSDVQDCALHADAESSTAHSPHLGTSSEHMVAEDDSVWGHVGSRQNALSGSSTGIPDTPRAKQAMRKFDNPGLAMVEPDLDKQVSLVRNRNGKMVVDPFAAQKAARSGQGIVHEDKHEGKEMKEHTNLVKNLRRLLETEVSQAEVMMAAKGFAQELQEMVEKIGRLQNEDLPPVTDQMRETYGMESASAFQTKIYGALQSVMDALYTAKSQVDDAVTNMAATGQVDAVIDMDKDIGLDMDDEMGSDVDAAPELDNIESELANDEFGGEEPLGRSMKTESLQLRVLEMQRLVEKARKLKEARA